MSGHQPRDLLFDLMAASMQAFDSGLREDAEFARQKYTEYLAEEFAIIDDEHGHAPLDAMEAKARVMERASEAIDRAFGIVPEPSLKQHGTDIGFIARDLLASIVIKTGRAPKWP